MASGAGNGNRDGYKGEGNGGGFSGGEGAQGSF